LPGTAPVIVGAPGAVAPGVTALEAAEAGPLPTLLAAVTVKVYVVPLASGLTIDAKVDPFGVVAVTPPGFEVTV
jgi:hypothetical protein